MLFFQDHFELQVDGKVQHKIKKYLNNCNKRKIQIRWATINLQKKLKRYLRSWMHLKRVMNFSLKIRFKI